MAKNVVPRPTRPTTFFAISPGDLDEAVQTYLVFTQDANESADQVGLHGLVEIAGEMAKNVAPRPTLLTTFFAISPGDLDEAVQTYLVGRLVGILGEDQVGLHGLVEIARGDGEERRRPGRAGHDVGHPGPGQAVALERRLVAVRAQPEAVLERARSNRSPSATRSC